MTWSYIIFALVAIAQGYAKWRKQKADEAKRSGLAASKKAAARGPGSRDPSSSVDVSERLVTGGTPWIPGDRDPERGGERLLATARQEQTSLGTPAKKNMASPVASASPAASKAGAPKSSELDVDLILKGFGLDGGQARIDANSRIEDLEQELNMLRERQGTLLGNWKKLRDERDALAAQLDKTPDSKAAGRGVTPSENMFDRLKSPLGAREAFVMSEILGPPVGSKRSGTQTPHN